MALGTTSSDNSLAGRRQPMTPVLDGRTEDAPLGKLSAAATASHTISLSATPSPPEHTLETLLLMTSACRGPPSANRLRPTLMGAPGNLFFVNTAAQLSVGSSNATTVALMGSAPIEGASTGTKVPLASPHLKPRGSPPCDSRKDKYSSLLENGGSSSLLLSSSPATLCKNVMLGEVVVEEIVVWNTARRCAGAWITYMLVKECTTVAYWDNNNNVHAVANMMVVCRVIIMLLLQLVWNDGMLFLNRFLQP
mmetsp:Transcript_2842/g.4470  ORF Transcript_2842/g.4470 Transcript_2842/m.4470 type:complete len:251 (+) Transcript_2842:898-1650(+)